jgi:ribosome-binding protein aMBF1 (putative translation factor)
MKQPNRIRYGLENARRNERRAFSVVADRLQDVNVRFGLSVRTARLKLGLSQARLSELTGIDRSYISDIERGQKRVSLEVAVRLTDALGTTLAAILN